MMFVSVNALKKGFLAGCEPFIGFYGYYLKGPCGGILLSTISLDANKGLFPIAFAIVESECKDSWLFIIEWLSELLGKFSEHKPWTFKTDRKKVFNI